MVNIIERAAGPDLEEIQSTEIAPETQREAWVGNTYAFYEAIGEVRDLTHAGEGFKQGASYPADVDLFSEEVQLDNIELYEGAAKRIMAAKGWDEIDILVGVSISTRRAVIHRAADNLRNQGIPVGESRDIYCACAGALEELVRILMDPKNKGKKVALCALEILSANAMNPDDNKASVTTRNMFGNALTGMGFVAGVDIEALNADIYVQPDLEGVIKVPQAEENLVDEGETLQTPPDFFHFVDPITHEVQGPDFDWSSQDYFVITENGVRLKMPATESGYTEMEGEETLQLFATFGAQYLVPFIEASIKDIQPEYGPIGPPMAHQPSLIVRNGLMRQAQTVALMRRLRPDYISEDAFLKANKNVAMNETQQAEYDHRKKSLSKTRGHVNKLARKSQAELSQILQGTGIPAVEIPWVMNEALVNNVSGGTPIVELIEMVRQGRIKPEVVTPAIGFAIGVMFVFANLIFHETDHELLAQN